MPVAGELLVMHPSIPIRYPRVHIGLTRGQSLLGQPTEQGPDKVEKLDLFVSLQGVLQTLEGPIGRNRHAADPIACDT